MILHPHRHIFALDVWLQSIMLCSLFGVLFRTWSVPKPVAHMVQARERNILSKTDSCLPLNTWPTAEPRGRGGQIFCYGKLQKLSGKLTVPLWVLVVSDAIHPSSKFSRWNVPMPLQLFWMPSLRAGADSLPPSLVSSDLSQRFCVFCTFGQDKTHKTRHGGVQSTERRVATVSATLHSDKPWSWGELTDELVHSLWLAIFIHIPRPKGRRLYTS